jgi:hypothetical protein
MRVTVEFEWVPIGQVGLEAGRLVFPPLATAPGLYRFVFEPGTGQRRVYIGEASDLARRAQHYRTPGASQRTNVRVNAELRAAIDRGERVEVSVIVVARLELDGIPVPGFDMSRKTSRLIVENAAMAEVLSREPSDERYAALINRPGVGEDGWV